MCMSRRTAGLIAIFVAFTVWTAVRAQQRPAPPQGPGLGVPATPAEIASADISIPPDGTGLPEGSGTPAQGAQVYAAKCIACHGPEGAGGVNDRLVGGQGTLKTPVPVKTIGSYWPHATTVFDYIRRAMPPDAPNSLSDGEVYNLVAFLLAQNELIPADAVVDAASLPKVKMPAHDRFVPDTRGKPKQ